MAKRNKTKPFSYSEALEELRDIVDQLEAGLIDIDDLAEKSERASELIKLCKEKLRNTERQVAGLFDEQS